MDLGCGTIKHEGCTGLDINPLTNAELIHDFQKPLPLPDDSVSFLMASRSLEYSDDLLSVMQEIYRICRHKAIVCIVAPYALTSHHLANPAMKSRFTEFSPYYFTPATFHNDLLADTEFAAYSFPIDALGDGTADSRAMDFRLLRMEVFYLPAYTSNYYESHEKIQLLQCQWNVAEEIMYHFVVVKEPWTPLDRSTLAAETLEEPRRISERRREELERIREQWEAQNSAGDLGGRRMESPAVPSHQKKGKKIMPKKRTRSLKKARIHRMMSESFVKPDIKISDVLFDIRRVHGSESISTPQAGEERDEGRNDRD